jgi:TolB-like protein
MAERNIGVPVEQRIEFRIGINVGDIIIDEGDIYGDGVNIAARLEALAEPGGICVSRVVRDQVRDKLDFAFADKGDQQVKNIARPVRAFRIGPRASGSQSPHPNPPPPAGEGVPAEGSLNYPPPQAGEGRVGAAEPPALPLPDKPSIVVLPFQNISGDPEQEYFADGMVEEIITALSRIRWLFVIARNSSFTYKGKAIDVKQVARELGVRYVLEGSVRKGGNRVRITAQLIDAETGTHLWADCFDGSLEDVFELRTKSLSALPESSNRHCGPRKPCVRPRARRAISAPTISTCARWQRIFRERKNGFLTPSGCSVRRSRLIRIMGRRLPGRRFATCGSSATVGPKRRRQPAAGAWILLGRRSKWGKPTRASSLTPLSFWRISARISAP